MTDQVQPQPAAPATASQQIPYSAQFAFFQIKGRLTRQHFWISWLILYVSGLVLGMIPGVNMIAGLAILWGKFAINIKRLNDMGQSGWFAALPLVTGLLSTLISLSTIAQLIGIVFSGPGGDASPYFMAMFRNAGLLSLLGLINLGFLLWIGLTKSQPETNAHG